MVFIIRWAHMSPHRSIRNLNFFKRKEVEMSPKMKIRKQVRTIPGVSNELVQLRDAHLGDVLAAAVRGPANAGWTSYSDAGVCVGLIIVCKDDEKHNTCDEVYCALKCTILTRVAQIVSKPSWIHSSKTTITVIRFSWTGLQMIQ